MTSPLACILTSVSTSGELHGGLERKLLGQDDSCTAGMIAGANYLDSSISYGMPLRTDEIDRIPSQKR